MRIENNFIGCIQYNHYGNYTCEESGCNDDGICRCYQIYQVDILLVDITKITKSIWKNIRLDDQQHNRNKNITDIIYGYDSDMVNQYCINRILTKNKVWDKSNIKPLVTSGYYGDEIEDVIINEAIFNKISNEIDEVLNIDTLEEKINYVLHLEYGYIRSDIENKKYEVISVKREDLYFGQDHHHKNVLHKKLEYYSDKNYLKNSINGIAYKVGDKWNVIDGYHRLTQTKLEKVKIIGIQ
jgi:hypothetical protein